MNVKSRILLYFQRIINKILSENKLQMTQSSRVGKNWFVSSSVLKGEFEIGNNVSCGNSKLSGVIKLGDKVRLNKAVLGGKISIDVGSKIVGGVKLKGEINIGKYSSLNGPNMDIDASLNPVSIGNFCSIARNVTFQEYNHDPSRMTTYFVNTNLKKGNNKQDIVSKGAITIGHDVWIGTHAVILSGANVGTGAVVAANSVVTGNIPPYAIVGGTPAKIIKYRFNEETIEKLLASKWWEKEIDEILLAYDEFES